MCFNYVWLKETLMSKKQQTAEYGDLYIAAKCTMYIFHMRWQNDSVGKWTSDALKSNLIAKKIFCS